MKQLAAICGLFAAIFFVLDATASPACLFAATALPVASGGFALHGPGPVGFRGSCFQHVPMGATMLSAAIAFGLFMGFGSMTAGLEKDSEGLEPAAFDATAWSAATLPLVFDIAATVGHAAFVPGFFFVTTFAALSALNMFGRFAGKFGFAPLLEVAQATAKVDAPTRLSVEFFEQYFVGDTVNLSALSKALLPCRLRVRAWAWRPGYRHS